MGAQRFVVRVLVEDGAGELRVLDEGVVRSRGQHVREGQAVCGLGCAEVHQVREARFEDGPVGADEPAAEVLEEGGAGGRRRTERA
jgi:hypothetical protein